MILEINIERLVIETPNGSFSAADLRPEQLEAALAGELARLFTEQGIPAPLQQAPTGQEVLLYTPRAANLPAPAAPGGFGEGVAQAVYASLNQMIPSGGQP